MRYFELLSKNEVEKVHEATLEIMETVGLNFLYQPALETLARGGAKIQGNRVYFPKRLVEDQLKKPPREFTLHARTPEKNLVIGGDHITFIPANCPPFVSDLDNGRRYGTLEDYENFVKLTGASQNLDMCSNTPVEPNDVPIELRHVKTLYASLKYSNKCLMGSVMGAKVVQDTLRMASIVFGDEKEMADKPRIISIPCSLTPLGYDERMLGAMMEYAKAGQPQLVNSLAIAGATAPITLAGQLAVQNAEILAGIVLIQLVREGAPVVYASGSSNADMRTGALCVGSPEMAMNNTLAAQMARFYNIPSRGVGALTDGKIPDAQAGYESMMNLVMAQNSGVHFVLHAAGALETINCISYEKFIIDDETVGMVKRIRRGIEVNEDSLALEVIKEVGPAGHFLDKSHTFAHVRSEFHQPVLSDRSTYGAWQKKGARQAMEAANKKWKEVLENYEPPELPASVEKDLQRFVDAI